MPADVAVVADDLTGAADTGIGFRRDGVTTMLTWATPVLDPRIVARGGVLAVDAETRGLDADGARVRTAQIVAVLRTGGVTTLYKKADSTLRGHVGEEIHAAVGAWHPHSVAIVALAFPRTRRTTVEGRQHVDGVPLDCPPIPAILARAGIATTAATLTDVREGRLADVLARSNDAGMGAVVCDAETDNDLHAIARAGVSAGRPVVWAGSGGLAPMVSAALWGTAAGGAHNRIAPAFDAGDPRAAGPVLIAVGSTSEIAREQAANLAAAGVTHVVVPMSALGGADAVARAAVASTIERHLRQGESVVVTLASAVIETGDREAVAAQLGQLLQPLAPLVGAFVATGGETASTILRAWGITALRLVDEIEPGVPLSVSVGPRSIRVVTKGGAFGDAATLTRAHAMLQHLSHTETSR